MIDAAEDQWKASMPRVGVEPAWDYFRQILSLVRIPISPPRRELKIIKLFSGRVNRSPEYSTGIGSTKS